MSDRSPQVTPNRQTPNHESDENDQRSSSREVDPNADSVASWLKLDERWFLYPAYLLAFSGGFLASHFAAGSPEWSPLPVLLAWGLLFVWYWLYGVAFRYRRPALKYFALAASVAFGVLLTAFCIDRALPQLAAADEGVAARGAVLRLVWAAITTGLSCVLIVTHTLLFSRFRGS